MIKMRILHRTLIRSKLHNKLLFVPVVILLTSCALNDAELTNPAEQMVPHNIRQHNIVRAELEFVTFTIPDQLEEPDRSLYYSLDHTQISYLSEQWKLALIKAFKEANMFESNSKNKLSLTLTVLEASSLSIFAVGADIKARYQIKDVETGIVVYSRDIRTNGRLKWLRFQRIGDDVNTDVLRAEELAINENIKEFMDSIDSSILQRSIDNIESINCCNRVLKKAVMVPGEQGM